MKLFKGIGLGILIGIAFGCVVILLTWLSPGFGCTCEFISCFLDCENNVSHLDAACVYCDQFLAGEGFSDDFDYQGLFVYAVIICALLGGLWGGSVTAAEAMEASRERKAKKEKEQKERYVANQIEMVESLEKFLQFAGYKTDGLYREYRDIQYHHKSRRDSIEIKLTECKNKKEETEKIINTLISGNDQGGKIK